MAKGYWVARVDVSDPDGYQQYVKANAKSFAKFNARFLVRGGAYQVPEGRARSRNVVIEFDSHLAALDCYYSPEYQAAKALREDAAESDLLIIEGYDGSQPGD
jgi:uncharacterized protein (DUF1330 family)|tara:strand:- start:161 stop:469 length:309 start_codon:yes stop_codon:yes gene_type:complete